MKLIKRLITIVLIMLPLTSVAADRVNVTGTISKFQIMGQTTNPYTTTGDAFAYIYMDVLPPACNSTSGNRNRVVITSNHPAFNVVVSAALAAKAANQTIQLSYLEECTLPGNPAWNFAILTVQ